MQGKKVAKRHNVSVDFLENRRIPPVDMFSGLLPIIKAEQLENT